MYYDDSEDFNDFDIDLINDLATGSNASLVATVGYASASNADVITLDIIHDDIQLFHFSIVCIYVIYMFCWICKQWG